MRPLSFRNNSKTIHALLNPHSPPVPLEEAPSFYDEDLQFSTFRSDDYRFFQHFPPGQGITIAGDSSQEDSSFNVLQGYSSDSDSDYESVLHQPKLSSYQSTNEGTAVPRSISFRNSSKTIHSILFKGQSGIGMRGVGFRNESVLLRGLLGLGKEV